MLISFLRAALIYLLLIFVIRLMGKRQIGQMEPSEFVLALVIADLAAVPMQDPGIPLLYGLIPIAVIVSLELLLSVFSYYSIRFRRFLCGKPVILIENGKILEGNLRKTRVTLDELTEQLRLKDILDIDSVQFAILETGGQLSVFPYPEKIPATAEDAGIAVAEQSLPITVISDGKLFKNNLKHAGKDLVWLKKQLENQKATIPDTLLLTVDRSNRIVFRRKEG